MNDILHGKFRQIDLNLLVALDALVQERSVSGAAKRLFIGQPAMSHALARLRELLGDEILFRSHGRMEPTSRALAIAAEIRPFLLRIDALTRGQPEFDPATVVQEMRIALSASLESCLLPSLVEHLRMHAPGLQLSVQSGGPLRQLELLQHGEVRLAIDHFPALENDFIGEPLGHVPYDCVFNPERVPLGENPGIHEILAQPHIHSTYAGATLSRFDQMLAARGLPPRRIVVRSASLLSIPFVVSESPLVAVLPQTSTRLFRYHQQLRICPVPLEGISLSLHIVRHRRDRNDPLLDYLGSCFHASWKKLDIQPLV